jgi:alpha-1,2-mannosyltransferase
MDVVWKRLSAHARLIWPLAIYSVLGFIWCIIFGVFLDKVVPRFRYLTTHSAVANDPPCATPECDFSQFWPAGLLARNAHYLTLYDPSAFWSAQQKLFFVGVGRADWLYPPPMLLPTMLVSYFPFETAFFVWSLAQALAAVWLLRWARLPWAVIIITFISPAALWNFELGQTGLFVNCCFLAGLLMSSRAEWRAGMAIGLLVFKPQAGMLAPVALLAGRHMRAVIAAGLMVVFVLFLTTFFTGIAVWAPFFISGRHAAQAILQAPFGIGYQQFGVSVFWMLRSFGLGLPVAYAVQIVSAFSAASLSWRLWRTEGDAMRRVALTVCLSLLVTPYGFTYDMTAYSAVLVMLVAQRGWRIGVSDAFFWLWPGLCPIVVMKTGLLLTPLVITMAVVRIWGMPHLPVRAAVLPRAG